MYQNLNEVRHVHLEISSFCNARCPLCPRNVWGYPYNDGYPEKNMTLLEVQNIFLPEFLLQLDEIYLNGNFGDTIMNPEAIDILEYFRENNAHLTLRVSTNASGRKAEFWRDLARLSCIVQFCIDGFEDTHSLYRQDTNWTKIIKNAKIFIESGGHAIFKTIKLSHNQNIISELEQFSREMGFQEFMLVDQGRNTGPSFDRKGNLVHFFGKPRKGEVLEINQILQQRKTDLVLLEDIASDFKIQKINCWAHANRSIYISVDGSVSPCCYLGLYPGKYGHGVYHQAGNQQFLHMIKNNNAHENPLEKCIKWFKPIPDTWEIPSFEQGRLMICNNSCGSDHV